MSPHPRTDSAAGSEVRVSVRPGRPPSLLAVARSIAFLFGVAILMNFLGELRSARFDATEWLIDLRFLPGAVEGAIIGVCGPALLIWSIAPRAARVRQLLTIAALAVLIIGSVINSVAFYRLVAEGTIVTRLPVPLSALFAVSLVAVLWCVSLPQWPDGRSLLRALAITPVAAGVFLLAQILFFGATSYRRPADAIVVFGARVYADGTPSLALEDRIRTGVALFHDGLAPRLIMSGGPGDGSVRECDAMAEFAVSLGVPREALLLDAEGINTRATVENTGRLLNELGGRRVLAVSHFYHMARVKLCFERAGIDAATVPAAQQRVLTKTPWFIAREVAALGYYYVRPLF